MAQVLVVDDEPIVRDVVARYLERDGHTIVLASDGETARELLEREQPALVVLDVMLPGLDGLALMRWIRARFDLPVILLTARGDESDRIVVRTFSITTAPKPASCTVPRVVGKRIAAAESLIKKAHCRVGNMRFAFSSTTKKGVVLSQSRPPGRTIAANSKIDLVVSRGRRG